MCNHPKVRTDRHGFETMAAAKAALTREVNRGAVNRDDFNIAHHGEYYLNIEKQVTKTNLMSGKPFTQSVNTSMVNDPSTETYWSV
jgi:hypothetical protein